MSGLPFEPITNEPDKEEYAGRNTNPGKKFELTIERALVVSGYSVKSQVNIGYRIGGTKHLADFVITKADRNIVVSSKWQATGGTGEDKIAWEAMTLGDALSENPQLACAYIVLGGDGWTTGKLEAFTTGALRNRIRGTDRVHCITLNQFLMKAYRLDL